MLLQQLVLSNDPPITPSSVPEAFSSYSLLQVVSLAAAATSHHSDELRESCTYCFFIVVILLMLAPCG